LASTENHDIFPPTNRIKSAIVGANGPTGRELLCLLPSRCKIGEKTGEMRIGKHGKS
jgi:N-acetyl-gamma-glutamylphosphate reductase